MDVSRPYRFFKVSFAGKKKKKKHFSYHMGHKMMLNVNGRKDLKKWI